MKKGVLILSLIFVFACEGDSGISDEKFIQVYQEVLMARESVADSLEGTSKVNEVFAKYNISEPEFRATFMKLSSENPKRLAELLDSIRIYTEIEIREIDSLEKASEMEQDTNSPTQSNKR